MVTIRKTSKWTFSLTLVVGVLAATLFGGFYGNRLFGSPVQSDVQKRLKEYTDLLAAVTSYAPDDIAADKFVYSSIDGMLRTLDPHTTFLEPKEYADMQDRQKGSFYGLGILVTKRNDQITEIEGVPTDDLTLDDVVKRLKGPKGTTVHIKILRVGIKEPIPLTIIRAAIPTNSISNMLMLRPGIGYIRIKDFTATTVRELDDAIDKLKAQGMQKLVLDLRGNPGGLLDAAVGVADHFLDKGQMIVYTKGRTPDSAQDYTAPGKHQKLDVPLVVVVNRGSASASPARSRIMTAASSLVRRAGAKGSCRASTRCSTAQAWRSRHRSTTRRPAATFSATTARSTTTTWPTRTRKDRRTRFRSRIASSSRPTPAASSTAAVESRRM